MRRRGFFSLLLAPLLAPFVKRPITEDMLREAGREIWAISEKQQHLFDRARPYDSGRQWVREAVPTVDGYALNLSKGIGRLR